MSQYKKLQEIAQDLTLLTKEINQLLTTVEKDRPIDLSDMKIEGFQNNLMVRGSGEYKNKGFYLSDACNWELKTDSQGLLVLVPTRK